VPVDAGETITIGDATLVLQGGPPRGAGNRTVARRSAMEEVRALALRVAASPLSMLLLGETGVGKGVLAREIHAASPRASKPFLQLNCAAVPEALLESELFGFERGAFTGAMRAKAGLLEAASGGTMLLDEIGETSPTTQAKLLRAIEQREVQRIGALAPRTVDVRFLSATNRDLAAEVERGAFRRDLFHRLCGICIEIPPLRDRQGEIELLAIRFLDEARRAAGLPGAIFAAEAIASLRAHAWSGNVRELRNVVERAAVLGGDALVIDVEHLAMDARRASRPTAPRDRPSNSTADDTERRRVLDALARYGGNQSRAAASLGMARRTLIARLETYGLPRPRKGHGR
jgi:transcriptional regulator with PAS, ATPase and Fis domain